MSSRAARSNNGGLTNSRNCTWYVMMDPKITPSGQTIVKPTACAPQKVDPAVGDLLFCGSQVPADNRSDALTLSWDAVPSIYSSAPTRT